MNVKLKFRFKLKKKMWLIIESNHTQKEMTHLPLCASRLSGDTFERTYRREQKKNVTFICEKISTLQSFIILKVCKKSEKVGIKLETSSHGKIFSFFKHCRQIKMRKYLHITKQQQIWKIKFLLRKISMVSRDGNRNKSSDCRKKW